MAINLEEQSDCKKDSVASLNACNLAKDTIVLFVSSGADYYRVCQ